MFDSERLIRAIGPSVLVDGGFLRFDIALGAWAGDQDENGLAGNAQLEGAIYSGGRCVRHLKGVAIRATAIVGDVDDIPLLDALAIRVRPNGQAARIYPLGSILSGVKFAGFGGVAPAVAGVGTQQSPGPLALPMPLDFNSDNDQVVVSDIAGAAPVFTAALQLILHVQGIGSVGRELPTFIDHPCQPRQPAV